MASPIVSWIKCNIDGTVKGCTGPAACGGIFRDINVAVLGCFAQNLHISIAFHVELIGDMLAVELASKKGWISLSLETDSQLISMTFKKHGLVPLSFSGKVLVARYDFDSGRVQSGGRLMSQWWRDLLFVKEGDGLRVGNWVDERVVKAVGWGGALRGRGGGGAGDYLLGRKIRIPTKDNLAKRDSIDPSSLMCYGACGKEENVTHLFFDCNFFGQLGGEVLKWLGICCALPINPKEHALQFGESTNCRWCMVDDNCSVQMNPEGGCVPAGTPTLKPVEEGVVNVHQWLSENGCGAVMSIKCSSFRCRALHNAGEMHAVQRSSELGPYALGLARRPKRGCPQRVGHLGPVQNRSPLSRHAPARG
ncbi:hypothetical protein TSUD_24220 [Trifolium subterraneum]|uniref:RNase H type-1 domain-containing protein n=1 Tax=Trifolium subterraneum TaxID=3900 RepID=A0A2Z6NMZ4_TRISU|nr:hypothetical protein TSUD_24220 [Trifolium subterraneum]